MLVGVVVGANDFGGVLLCVLVPVVVDGRFAVELDAAVVVVERVCEPAVESGVAVRV